MIVVEGPDGAGKSTLVAKLAKEFNLTTYTIGAKPTSDAEIVSMMTLCENRATQWNVIQDRVTHMSTFVYDALLSPSRAGLALSRLPRLIATRPLVIFCRPSERTLCRVLDVRDEAFKTYKSEEHRVWVRQHIESIAKLYDVLAHTMLNSSVGVLTYSYDDSSWTDEQLFTRVGVCIEQTRTWRAKR